jgi:HD superfamily phosphohydrolase YqeK
MPALNESLLLKFRAKDTSYGVTRSTIKALASELEVSETQVIHLALSKFAADVLPAYEPDDGALTAKQLAAVRHDAAKHMPQGKTLERQALFS